MKERNMEKVLTVSARDYVESVNKKLNDYTMIGVHSMHSIDEFYSEIPKETEAIVNFSKRINDGYYCYAGTALIPKK